MKIKLYSSSHSPFIATCLFLYLIESVFESSPKIFSLAFNMGLYDLEFNGKKAMILCDRYFNFDYCRSNYE